MKWKLLISAVIIMNAVPALAQDTPPLTAREYYEELKAANNFSHHNDTYVCFRDDDVPSFVVISKGSDIIEEMKGQAIYLRSQCCRQRTSCSCRHILRV